MGQDNRETFAMKIAWFTPLAKESAIGKVSLSLCRELSRDNEVTIWTPLFEKLLETDIKCQTFDDSIDIHQLDGFDIVIYNMGNFAGYHREIYDISQKVPGIVILHDRNMAGFFWQYYCVNEFGGDAAKGCGRFQELVNDYYGLNAVEIFDKYILAGETAFSTISDLRDYSFLEPVVDNAKAVFTHSASFLSELENITNLPVEYSYLPCEISYCKGEADHYVDSLIKDARQSGKKIIVSTGIVHPIKNINLIVDIIERTKDIFENIVYFVAGSYGGDYGKKLKALSEGELKDRFYLLGYQSESNMMKLIREADLIVNLRYPNSEVCSLSLLEQMAFGKPVLAFDTGIFGEMPDNCLIKIKKDRAEIEAERILLEIVDGRKDFENTGKKAENFVKTRCTGKVYIDKLCSLIDRLEFDKGRADFQDHILHRIYEKMGELGIHEGSAPKSFNLVIKDLNIIFGAYEGIDKQVLNKRRKTIGIWIAFAVQVESLSAQGVCRQMSYIVSSMLKYHEDVAFEIWYYSINEEEIKKIFSSVRSVDNERILYINEKNWREELTPSAADVNHIGEVTMEYDNLSDAARIASKAELFIPVILYLDRIAEAGKRLFVPGYDMAVASHYKDFVSDNELFIAQNSDIVWRTANLVRYGAKYFCNSDTVRKQEILRYIPDIKEADTRVIYLAPNVPESADYDYLSEKTVRSRFKIEGDYLFYPTQFRPYKNVETLIRAFAIIRDVYRGLKLVLTGDPADNKEVADLLKKSEVADGVILLRHISEQELYSVYHYAAAIPVPSLFEGGIPYQALEGLYAKSPVVLSDIPMVKERISFVGYTVDTCGIKLFDPKNDQDLAEKLSEVLEDREGALKSQERFAEDLLSYTWKDSTDAYYDFFFGSVVG